MKKPILNLIFLSAECGTCIKEFYQWEKFAENVRKLCLPIQLIFYVKTSDSTKTEKLLSALGFKQSYYFDTQASFIEANNIPDSPFISTIITDHSNKIIFIGNFMKSKYQRKKFIKLLKLNGL